MKKTTTILMFSIALLSCKKESTDSKLVNAAIDQELFANVSTMTDAQLTDLAKRKYNALQQVKKDYPGITVDQLYPDLAGVGDPDQRTANRGGDCQTQYTNSRAICDAVYLKNSGAAVSLGSAAAVVSTPVGGLAVGLGMLLSATFDYRVCADDAIKVKKNCETNNLK